MIDMVKSGSKSIILGTVQLGTTYGIRNKSFGLAMPSSGEAHEILDCAYENGIRHFDTARDYGVAEEVIGGWPLKSRAHILTKLKNAESLTQAEEIFGRSLEALGLREIYSLSLHLFEECLRDHNLKILEHLKRCRLIRHTGISIYNTHEIYHVVKYTDIELIQSPFNVLDHYGLRGEAFANAKRNGRMIHVRSVFLQGLLLMDPEGIPPHLEALRDPVRALSRVATEAGCGVRDFCIAYVMNTPDLDGVIIGVDNKAELLQNLVSFAKFEDFEINRAKVESGRLEDLRVLNPSLWGKI
jgi:aryl-alcohol dehydrogenase-like predicted oxidoreductase